VINLLRQPRPKWLCLQAFCSLIPAVLATAMAGAEDAELLQMAVAAEPPRPNVSADLLARGLLQG
jgi:hypothetical protein